MVKTEKERGDMIVTIVRILKSPSFDTPTYSIIKHRILENEVGQTTCMIPDLLNRPSNSYRVSRQLNI